MDLAAQLTAALADRYAIEREIGAGGMARVFLARDLRHDRRVALKVLNPELAAMVGADRFFAEIKVTASLQHPHLLPLFDSGAADGQLFYVMPYMEGETLRQRLTRETMLPVDEALRITTAVASALEHAHRHGVVHRDLKPENILLHEGEPMVADFGIALAVSNAGGERVTQTGMSLGTPQYMSPEQATGDRQIDARSDVYSLAAVLYEMLTGDPPHVGTNSQAVIAKVITEKPRGIRETREAVPAQVEATVLRALSKLPADRFGSAAEFAAAINTRMTPQPAAAATGSVTLETRPVPAGRAAALASARRYGIPAVLLLGAGLAGSLLKGSGEDAAPVAPLRFDIHWTEAASPSPTAAGNLALSHDGTRLVRTPVDAGPRGVYSRPMDGLSWSLIPGTDSVRATAPTFSPDGRFVLYSATTGPEGYVLWRLPVEGGEPVRLADSVDSDGFTWGDKDRVLFFRSGAIWTVSALGGNPALLVEPDSSRNQAAFAAASFLPGGAASLVTIIHGARRNARLGAAEVDSAYLGAVSLDGTVTDFGVRGVGAKYSLGHLLYADPTGALMALPFDAKRLRVTGGPTRLAERVLMTSNAAEIVVSDNGWLLYVPQTIIRNATNLARYRLDRVTPPRTTRPVGIQEQDYQSFSISPDGERVALCVVSSQQTSDVWILQMASGHLSPLTRDGKSCWPVWTRDGRRVAYRVGDQVPWAPGVWLSVPWDLSGQPEPVPGTEGAIGYEPGPPGGYFATVRPDSTSTGNNPFLNADIWIAPVDTPQARRPLSATAGGEWAPRISPDGRWVAFMLREQAGDDRAGFSRIRDQIYMRPLPGPGAMIPVSKAASARDPFWGKDESVLYYNGREAGGPQLFAASLDIQRQNPVLQERVAVPTFATSSLFGGSGRLPDGDFLTLTFIPQTQGRGRAGGPTPPPNPIALLGWTDLVKGATAPPPSR